MRFSERQAIAKAILAQMEKSESLVGMTGVQVRMALRGLAEDIVKNVLCEECEENSFLESAGVE